MVVTRRLRYHCSLLPTRIYPPSDGHGIAGGRCSGSGSGNGLEAEG